MKCVLVLIACIAMFDVHGIKSAKILSIFNIPSPSHYIYASALLKELAARGHEITSVTTYPQKNPIKNFHDVFIENNTRIFDDEVQDGNESESAWKTMADFISKVEIMCNNIYQNPDFQEIMKNPKGKFDLIIVEVIWSDSLYGLGQHFGVPMIGLSTFGTMVGLDDVVGNISPNSVVPNVFSSMSPPMSFWDRLNNLYNNFRTYVLYHTLIYYKQKALYEKYLPNAKLDFSAAAKNFSLLILNQHHSLSFPRAYVTNVIEAGGLHIKRNPEPLSDDLQKWMDSAPDGVIYFSMGSNIKSKDLPLYARNVFLNVFRKLKQKVLWKFEDSELPGKPDNVLINPWLNQHSVLNHKNVKVFITHGGLLSTTEAIFFGKPILGIPMMGDQPRNIKLAENRGIALSVSLQDLNEQNLEHALNELLYNPKYTEKMQTISSHYHDQPLTPMELAVFWVEYILRHGDGAHLRNAGVNLNLLQYYSVDVILFLLIACILMLSLPIWIVSRFFKQGHQAQLKKRKSKKVN